MDTQEDAAFLLRRVENLLRTWGWVQHRDRDEMGFDLIGAFEEIERCQLLDIPEEADRLLDAFANPRLDVALRALSETVPGDPDDGAMPAERWVWVHRITTFNDDPTTAWPDVVRTLGQAVAATGATGT